MIVRNAPESPGHFLKEWRQSLGMNQKQFAEHVGISISNYNYLEAGRIGYTQKTLEAIAEALSVSPASLLSRNPLAEMAAQERHIGSPREELEEVVDSLSDDSIELLLDLTKTLRRRELAKWSVPWQKGRDGVGST